jgi:hypothetical protein
VSAVNAVEGRCRGQCRAVDAVGGSLCSVGVGKGWRTLKFVASSNFQATVLVKVKTCT